MTNKNYTQLSENNYDRYFVRADHPILARPDKGNLTISEAQKLIEELSILGYENITMNLIEKR